MKWGTLYPPDYVNVLYNACRGAVSGEVPFVCLTDDPSGLLPGIEALPIPDIGLTRDEMFRRGAWPKIALYDADLQGLRGRCLFIDLDMVILGGLDVFFAHEAAFVGLNAGPNWGRADPLVGAELGTGIFSFTLGAHGGIADAFRADKAGAFRRFRNEQQFVQAHLPEVAHWPQEWVISFKRSLRQPVLLDLILPVHRPPLTARVLAFHGRPRPIDLIRGRPFFWDRFPHLGHGRVAWMADYWRRNGGRDI